MDPAPFQPSAAADPRRRRFLVTALATGLGALVGCDPPASTGRSRALPGASEAEGGRAATTEPAPASQIPVPVPVERPRPPTSEPLVRVRIATLRPPARRLRIDGDGPRIYVASQNGPPKSVATPVEIEASVDGWVVIEAAGSRRAGTFQFTSPELVLRPVAGSRGIRFGANLTGTTAWPYDIVLTHRTDEAVGAIDIVCHVMMESYLPGVLAKELYPNWSLDAFLSQAVAARSFALCEMAQFSDRHFDVVAGEASQAWVGATSHRQSIEAVQRTRGMVLVWDGRVVPAYYSSTCGGRPANATDAISSRLFNAIPPLTVTADSARDCCRQAPAWRWKLSLPVAETGKRIALWARTERPALARIDGLRRIEVARSNACGRPVAFRLVDSRSQEFEIPAEHLRWALNADVPGLPVVRTRVKSADFEPKVSAVSVHLEGRGFGHGVGMCQYGAEALSKSGRTWREVLRFYYPGSEIVAAYGATA